MRSIVSEVSCQSVAMKCIHILFAVRAIKDARILFISALFAMLASMIKFLPGQIKDPATKLKWGYSIRE